VREYDDKINWMEDDSHFSSKKKTFAAFVEVTMGRCKLNGPWTDREKNNLPRALNALGAVLPGDVEVAANDLYDHGVHQSSQIEIGLISIGNEKNPELKMPCEHQILWKEIKAFIFDRFSKYRQIKREHPQWDSDGHLLWKVFEENYNNKENFFSSLDLVQSPRSGLK